MIVENSNELFEHYKRIEDIEKTCILNKFEVRVLKASILSLGQIYNPLHYTNFCLNLREILGRFIDRISNEEDIKKAWWYEKPEKAVSGITTNQKYKYYILGNTPIEFHELLTELGIDVDSEIEKLTTKQKNLNKHTHFNEKTLEFTWDEAKQKSLSLLQEFLNFLLFVNQINKTLQEHIADSINDEVVIFFISNYINKFDEIATHYFSPEPEIERITCDFDDKNLFIEITGNVSVDFQVGSNSDLKHGDGLEFSKNFPFIGNMFSDLEDIKTIKVDGNWLDIDTSEMEFY